MATSGAMGTSNQYVNYTITITQNSQNLTNNTTNVTVSVRFYRTNTGYTTYGTGTVYCKINGVTYSAAVTSSQKITNAGIILFTKTLDIPHNDDGTKSLTCSAWISHNVVTSNEQSYTETLGTIARKSTMDVGNGTLGATHTLTVYKQSSSFTHTITVTCGSASTTVCTKSPDAYIAFTPPIEWASQNIANTVVWVEYTITTYSGDTNVGSNSYGTTLAIPDSVKPSCTITVSDATGYSDIYGGYVKGRSKLTVTVNPILAYNSDITAYSTTINGGNYTERTFTTSELRVSGTVDITSRVLDRRGRSGTGSTSINVIDYNAPSITLLKVNRCTSDGVINDEGDHIKITFSCTASSLNSKNTTQYHLKYKKSSETEYSDIPLSLYDNQFTVNEGYYVIAADTGSSYDVKLLVTDNFETVTRTTVASTAATIMHFKANGRGMSVGKVSEFDDTFEVAWKTRLTGGLDYPTLQNETDFDTVFLVGFYIIKDVQSSRYSNCPFDEGTGTLTVEYCGDSGQTRHTVAVCTKGKPERYERCYSDGTWGEWVNTSDLNGKLLWSGALHMHSQQSIPLAGFVSGQRHGIVLVFSTYINNVVNDYDFSMHFVPKMQIANHNGCGHTFLMASNGTLEIFASKYLYIFDGYISGNDNNTAAGTSPCGILCNNANYVLRYVIGV